MQVLQCPKCEIRLPSMSELKDHLATDHPDFDASASSGDASFFSAGHPHSGTIVAANKRPRESRKLGGSDRRRRPTPTPKGTATSDRSRSV